MTAAPTITTAPTTTTAPTMTPDYHAALAALPTLTLDELVATAAMQTRIDRKYLLPRAALAEVVAAVATEAAILDIDGQRAFGYRSVYLDTPDLDSYFAAGRGRRRRFKVRTRSYLDTGTTWLEIKTRGPRGTTVKERIAHPDAEAAGLTAVGQDFLAQCLGSALIPTDVVADLVPVLATAYRRTTLRLGSAGAHARAPTSAGPPSGRHPPTSIARTSPSSKRRPGRAPRPWTARCGAGGIGPCESASSARDSPPSTPASRT